MYYAERSYSRQPKHCGKPPCTSGWFAADEENKYSDSTADKEKKKEKEEIVEDESTSEDYKKFDVDKVDNLEDSKEEKD